MDLFAYGGNNQCDRLYVVHWCIRVAGINKCLRATLDMRELRDQLSLQLDRQSEEIAKGAKGVGNYVDSFLGVCPMVAARMPRY